MGTCGGPAHLSGESLEAIHPPELRCQSQEAMLKAEFDEATRITPPPTEEPQNKVKCPANCVCEVSGELFEQHVSGVRPLRFYDPLWPVHRRRHTTPHVRTAATPKCLGASHLTRVFWICVATIFTTSPATASLASHRLCPCTCSAARLWRWKERPSVG